MNINRKNGILSKITASLLTVALLVSMLCFSAIATGETDTEKSEKAVSVPYRDLLADMDSLVSVKFVDTDIKLALNAISAGTGYETVYIGSSAKITIALSNVTVKEAYDQISASAGLEWRYDGETVYVSDAKTLEKLDISSFSCDFKLNYVSAEDVKAKLANVNIDVKLEANDKAGYITAKAKASELTDFYRLLSMIDVEASEENEQNGLYTISTEYITANELSRFLFSLSLPSGIINKDAEKNEITVYSTPSIYSKVLAAKEISDKKPDNLYPPESALLLAKVKTEYIDTTIADQLLTELCGTNTIKTDKSHKTLWIYATAHQIADANRLLSLADTNDENVKPEELRIIDLDFISGEDFEKLLHHFEITTSKMFEDDPERIYVFADDETLNDINTLRMIVDRAEYVDNSTAEIVFHKYDPQFITKEATADYLVTVGCGAKIVEIFGEDDAIWLYGDEAAITYALEMLAIFDTDKFKEDYIYRVYNIQNTDFFALSDTMLYDEDFAQYTDFYYIIPVDEKTIIVAAHPFSLEAILNSIKGFDVAPE